MASLARFVIIDFSARNYNRTFCAWYRQRSHPWQRITECGVRLRVVENLLTKELKAAHATRLRFYKDKEFNVTAELAQAAEHNDHRLYVVSKILDARYSLQEMFYELLVARRDFLVGEASWKPYSVMAVDVPDMVAKFIKSYEDIETVREMRSL
jgi:hypothetical protein